VPTTVRLLRASRACHSPHATSVASSTRCMGRAVPRTTCALDGRGFFGHSQCICRRPHRSPVRKKGGAVDSLLVGDLSSSVMTVRRILISLVAVALLLLPAFSYAGAGHGGHGGWGHGFHGHGFHGHGFHGHGFHGHGFHGGGLIVVGPGCCWGPWWWGYPPYYPPPAYYPPPYYYPPAYGPPPGYSPPVGYAPPAATVSVTPTQPAQNVVQFATGRYELRGNGMSTPYRWVWIPNPPTAPPQATPAGSQPVASAR